MYEDPEIRIIKPLNLPNLPQEGERILAFYESGKLKFPIRIEKVIAKHNDKNNPFNFDVDGYKGINYELCDDKGKIICKIPQRIVAKKLEDKGFKSNPMTESETRERAVIWSKSMGYPIPIKMGGYLAIILVIIGLCVFVVPGILILLWVWYQGNQYERDMRQLVAKWIDAGKPTPGKKENLEKTLEIVPEKNSEEEIEQKLKDLSSMKERNVISDEEYKEMRKKILGL